MHALLYVMIVQSKKKPKAKTIHTMSSNNSSKAHLKKKIYEDISTVQQLFIFSDDFIFQLTTSSLGNFFGNCIISVFKFLNNYDING